MKAKPVFLISLIILIICTYLLASGSDILGKSLIKGQNLPVGTLVAWAGLVSLPLTFYAGMSKVKRTFTSARKIFRYAIMVFVILAALWGPVSYLLAGNWSFTFEQQAGFRGSIKASGYFWKYTIIIVVLTLVFMLFYFLYMLTEKQREKIKDKNID